MFAGMEASSTNKSTTAEGRCRQGRTADPNRSVNPRGYEADQFIAWVSWQSRAWRAMARFAAAHGLGAVFFCFRVCGNPTLDEMPAKVRKFGNNSPHRCQQACMSASTVWPPLHLRCIIAAYLM